MNPSSASGENRLALTAGLSCYLIWGFVPLVFQAIGALVGQVMKLTRGTANPKVVHALIQRHLDA